MSDVTIAQFAEVLKVPVERLLAQLAEAGIENGGPDAVPLPADMITDLAGIDIVCVQFAPLSGAFIQAAADLKVIGVLRGGTENIAVDAATQRNIAVLNTPGRNARAVADGLALRTPVEYTLSVLENTLDGMLLVSEEAVYEAIARRAR